MKTQIQIPEGHVGNKTQKYIVLPVAVSLHKTGGENARIPGRFKLSKLCKQREIRDVSQGRRHEPVF